MLVCVVFKNLYFEKCRSSSGHSFYYIFNHFILFYRNIYNETAITKLLQGKYETKKRNFEYVRKQQCPR